MYYKAGRDLNCALLEQGGVLIAPDLSREGPQLCITEVGKNLNCALLEQGSQLCLT